MRFICGNGTGSINSNDVSRYKILANPQIISNVGSGGGVKGAPQFQAHKHPAKEKHRQSWLSRYSNLL